MKISKKNIFLLYFLFSSFLTFGQVENLSNFNARRLQTNRTALTILGTWAIGNIAVGAVLMGRSEGETRYFQQMNVGWNVVNLALAGFGYYAAAKTDPNSFGLFETIQEQHGIQKLLLLNIGLDVAYMTGGAYLLERSKTSIDNALRFKGFGKSILLQGAFLFVFDLGFYLAHAAHNPHLEPLLSGLQFSGSSIRWVYIF